MSDAKPTHELNLTLTLADAPETTGDTLAVVTAASGALCAVLFVRDAAAAVAEITRRFGTVPRQAPAPAGSLALAQVQARVRDPWAPVTVPLQLQGTPFQRRVWAALQRIPVGTTVTYAQLAEQVGAPTAVRAVASACGRNPVAVLVACHRVLRGDGGLGGFYWGTARKAQLLALEAAGARGPAADAHA